MFKVFQYILTMVNVPVGSDGMKLMMEAQIH